MMGIYCVAFGCKSHQGGEKTDKNISFHRFPHKQPSLLKKWVLAVRRKDWKPTKYSRLCSKHFTKEDYDPYRPGAYVMWLLPDAVPSIFDFPSQKAGRQQIENRRHVKGQSQSAPMRTRLQNSQQKLRTVNSKKVLQPVSIPMSVFHLKAVVVRKSKSSKLTTVHAKNRSLSATRQSNPRYSQQNSRSRKKLIQSPLIPETVFNDETIEVETNKSSKLTIIHLVAAKEEN